MSQQCRDSATAFNCVICLHGVIFTGRNTHCQRPQTGTQFDVFVFKRVTDHVSLRAKVCYLFQLVLIGATRALHRLFL